MTDETKTVIRVFEKDALRLKRIFGQPQWDAFRKVLAVSECSHPEGMRRYTTALVPGEGEDTVAFDTGRTVNGFRCKACGRYIFPDPDAE